MSENINLFSYLFCTNVKINHNVPRLILGLRQMIQISNTKIS